MAGFHTEYSGLRWSLFFMAEYGSMFIVSGLAAILFFGGWNGPIPIFGACSGRPTESFAWLQYVANLAGCVNFIGKAVLGVVVMMWVRWTLPRLADRPSDHHVLEVLRAPGGDRLPGCLELANTSGVYEAPEDHVIHGKVGLDPTAVRENWVVPTEAPPTADAAPTKRVVQQTAGVQGEGA